MGTRKWSLVVALCILSLYGSSAKLRMTPDNTAGVVGSSVALPCQGSVDDLLSDIIWNEYISDTDAATTLTVGSGLVPDAPNRQLYSITGDSSVSQYHLNIELAFLSGGRYECNEPVGSLFSRAHVTVLQSDPVCSDTIQADNVVKEGEAIIYICEVAYNSTSIDWPPVMSWTRPGGTTTGVIKLSTSGGTVSSSVNVTGAPGLNGAVYSVRIHFEAFGGSLPADHATNVPTYSHTHSFKALQVHYSSRDIAFQPDGNTFNPGDQLTCSANGNPAVSYKWYNSTDNSTLADGAELSIREDMDGLMCSCEAYNTIRGMKHSMSKEILLTVNKSHHSSVSTTKNTHMSARGQTAQDTVTHPASYADSGMSPGVVAGIAIAVILLLGILVVSLVVLLLHMRKVPAEQFNLASTELQSTNVSGSRGVYETPDRCEQESNRLQYANVNSCESEYEKPDAKKIKVTPSEYEKLAVPPVTSSSDTNGV